MDPGVVVALALGLAGSGGVASIVVARITARSAARTPAEEQQTVVDTLNAVILTLRSEVDRHREAAEDARRDERDRCDEKLAEAAERCAARLIEQEKRLRAELSPG